MKLGICYYPEHWPAERWPIDAQQMRTCGISIVRIGEFAWAQMEPAEEQYDWDWLDRVIEILAAEGLEIVLGTPTAAAPAWLVQVHPDILPVDAEGRTRCFGSRRHYCANSPDYRRHTKRIVAAMASRYGEHPAIIGWQTDNEFGCHDTARCYCHNCVDAFRLWLQEKYTSLIVLNDAWGTAFWSQNYSDWQQVTPPILTVAQENPQQVLDFHRFSSDSWVDYQKIQIQALRKHSPGRFVTHNFITYYTDLDLHALSEDLDFPSWDSYPTGASESLTSPLYNPEEERTEHAYDTGDPAVIGFGHDLTRGIHGGPFYVMEQQSGQINWSMANTGVRSGTLRLWTWQTALSGAEAMVIFRWRAPLVGFEQYHSGLLKHDGSFSVAYRDLLEMQDELAHMAQVCSVPMEVPVALLYDYQDEWALQLQPHRQGFGHLRHLFVYYRALQRLGIPVDIISPHSDISAYRVAISPTSFLADEKLADRFSDYVDQGGTLLMGIRSGFKTLSNAVIDQPLPGVFRDLVGINVDEWHSLPSTVSYTFDSDIPDMDGSAAFWAESLSLKHQSSGQRIRAKYTGGPFVGQAALTENRLGSGRAFYLGWYPTLEQAQVLLAHITEEVGIASLPDLPSGVVAYRRGEQVIYLNFSDQTQLLTHQQKTVKIEPRGLQILADSSAYSLRG